MSLKKMIHDHKPMDEMEESEKDTVALTCMMGVVIGALVVFVPMLCVGVVILAAVTQ